MIHVIVNAGARVGRKAKASDVIEKALKAHGKTYRIYPVKEPGETKLLCEQICSEPGPQTIWVAGGDGTAYEAINGIKPRDDLRVAYLPAGSGNDLARGLGIPSDLNKALGKLLSAKGHKDFDYGEMDLIPGGKTCFAGSSGIGYDAKVCVEVNESKLKKRLNRFGLGKLAYFLVAIKQVFVNPRFNMTLIADGGMSRSYSDVIFVCMMNHPYEGGGLKMAPKADPCDGKITVTFAYNISPLKVLFVLPRLMRGTHLKLKNVVTFDCTELELITDRKQYVHNDGEVVGMVRHLKVRCGEGKLHMPM
ncbi:MAG: diacylglycerol kinase family lipid kinase [Lachnospiraceae bacterium]|nr:diacylglycerol kinase family lipid kinase [Lachnospiraceae bacterium]